DQERGSQEAGRSRDGARPRQRPLPRVVRALRMSAVRALVLALCAASLAACARTRTLADPTLEIPTASGKELGVPPDSRIVLRARPPRAGDIEVTAFFGDGPDVEKPVIEPIGNGSPLYTAETEIRLPQVSMTFEEPAPGTELLVIGRDKKGPWKA